MKKRPWKPWQTSLKAALKNPNPPEIRRMAGILLFLILPIMSAPVQHLSALTVQAEYSPDSRRCSVTIQDYPAMKILENLDQGLSSEITCRVIVKTHNGPFAPVLYRHTVTHQAAWDRFSRTYRLTKVSSKEEELRFQDPFSLMDAFFSFPPQLLPPEILSKARRHSEASLLLEVKLLPVKLTPPLHIITLFPGTSATPLTDTALISLGDSP